MVDSGHKLKQFYLKSPYIERLESSSIDEVKVYNFKPSYFMSLKT